MGYAIIGVIIAILAVVSIRIRSMPIRFMFGLSWLMGLVYYNFNKPTTIPDGSPQDVAIFVVTVGAALITCVWAFTNNIRVEEVVKLPNGGVKNITKEHIKFEAPEWFSGINGTGNNEDFATRFRKTYSRDEYRSRNHRALFQGKDNRKR